MKAMATVVHTDPKVPSPVELFSVTDLDNVLDTLTVDSPADAPWMAHVTRSNGDTLSVGLGKPLVVDEDGELDNDAARPDITVLSWVAADHDPPYFAARATVPLPHSFVFFAEGSWSEFSAEFGVATGVAREVLREFIAGEGLPTGIEWGEV
jgi:hypothetical protein